VSVAVLESVTSRAARSGSKDVMVDYHYAVRNTDDALAATLAVKAAAADQIPWVESGEGLILHRAEVEVNPVHIDEENEDDCLWSATAHYMRPERIVDTPETGESEVDFDIQTDITHITQSLNTVGKYAAGGGTANDLKGAIGYTDAGNVEGCDILTPTVAFSETHYLAAATVTPAYINTLIKVVGKVNNATWRTWEAGEVLCLGISGRRRGLGDWAVRFNFGVSENQSEISIGDGAITGIAKKGWEYLWVRYHEVIDEGDYYGGGEGKKSRVMQPLAAYVEQVYRYANFANLGIDGKGGA
jgi:hypothetical protein